MEFENDEFNNEDLLGANEKDLFDGKTKVHISVDVQDVVDSTEAVIEAYIVAQSEIDNHQGVLTLKQHKTLKKLAVHMVRMADDLNKDVVFQRLLSELDVGPSTVYGMFQHVALHIFEDNVTWGKVVILLYFAYQLIVQSFFSSALVSLVVSWAARFVKERLATWIAEQGGWQALYQTFNPKVIVAIFLGTAAVTGTYVWLTKS